MEKIDDDFEFRLKSLVWSPYPFFFQLIGD